MFQVIFRIITQMHPQDESNCQRFFFLFGNAELHDNIVTQMLFVQGLDGNQFIKTKPGTCLQIHVFGFHDITQTAFV